MVRQFIVVKVALLGLFHPFPLKYVRRGQMVIIIPQPPQVSEKTDAAFANGEAQQVFVVV
jgi:hypothetical protein